MVAHECVITVMGKTTLVLAMSDKGIIVSTGTETFAKEPKSVKLF